MEKINFENLPSTNTPLSAENLNLLQTNVEDAINDNTDMLIGNTPAGDMVVDSIRSKNMFDKNSATLNYRLSSSGEPYADSNYVLSNFIEVKPSTEYTYSRYASGGGSAAVAFYDSSKTFISRTMWSSYMSDNSISFQTTANTYYIRFCDNKELVNNMQIEEGSTSTTYSPYQNLENKVSISEGNGYRLYKTGNLVFCFLETGGSAITNGTVINLPEGFKCKNDVRVYTRYYDGSSYTNGYLWAQSGGLYIRTEFSNTPSSASYIRSVVIWEAKS